MTRGILSVSLHNCRFLGFNWLLTGRQIVWGTTNSWEIVELKNVTLCQVWRWSLTLQYNVIYTTLIWNKWQSIFFTCQPHYANINTICICIYVNFNNVIIVYSSKSARKRTAQSNHFIHILGSLMCWCATNLEILQIKLYKFAMAYVVSIWYRLKDNI